MRLWLVCPFLNSPVCRTAPIKTARQGVGGATLWQKLESLKFL